MREASRADLDTLSRIAHELRAQVATEPRLQDEIDGVVSRWMADHPERANGGERRMIGPEDK